MTSPRLVPSKGFFPVASFLGLDRRAAAFWRVGGVRQQPGRRLMGSAVAVPADNSSMRTIVTIALVIFYSLNSNYEGTKLHIFLLFLLLFEKYFVLLHRILR